MLSTQTFSSHTPTRIMFGTDVVNNHMVSFIRDEGANKVMIVTDPGIASTGIVDEIAGRLSEAGIGTAIFRDVEPNPTSETVRQGIVVYKENECQMLIAIGGGSVIDAAKSILVMTANDGDILDYRRGGRVVQGPLCALYTIPTTAGTGSEVTAVSVITDTKKKRKFIVASPWISPKIAWIDPVMTYSLPRHHIAATGMDALVHAIEAYTSNRAHPVSDGFALQAIRIIREHLPASYADPTNKEAKAQVLLASTIAGYAFSLSGTALVHSMSHPLTAWFHIPHGMANAVLLPYIVGYNLISKIDKFADIARIFDMEANSVSKYKAAEKLVGYIKHFSAQLGIPEHFGDVQAAIDDKVIDGLAEDALDDRGTLPNNPRRPSKEDIVGLYKTVFPQYRSVVNEHE